MIVNAEKMILGRMAASIAKKALLGEKVDVINCEKAVVTGTKDAVLGNYKQKFIRTTPGSGPFFPKTADMFVRRVIRGMLPYKKKKGDKAFKNIKCHVGVPAEFKDKKIDKIEEASIQKSKSLSFVTVKEICEYLGGRV